MRPLDPLRNVAEAADIARAGTIGAVRSGLAKPRNPLVASRMVSALRKWGTTPGLGFALGAVRDPEATAIVDVDDPQQEEITFADAEYCTTVLANSLLDRGAQPGTTVGLLGRNSRAYAETIVAVSRTGADLVYLNTGSSAEQVAAVCAAHDITMLIRDREFADLCPDAVLTLGLDDPAGIPLLDCMPWSGDVSAPRQASKHVILTSGTTGGPLRGAARTTAPLDSVAALLNTFPTKVGGVTLLAAPLFHAWGWMHHRLASVLDSTQVLLRHSDPERILALAQAYEVDTIITVPVTLKRLVDLPEDTSGVTTSRPCAASPSPDRRFPATWPRSSWMTSGTFSTTCTGPRRRPTRRSRRRRTCARIRTPPGAPCLECASRCSTARAARFPRVRTAGSMSAAAPRSPSTWPTEPAAASRAWFPPATSDASTRTGASRSRAARTTSW
jgi:hypothetical protein